MLTPVPCHAARITLRSAAMNQHQRMTPANVPYLGRGLIPLPMRVSALQKARLALARERTGMAVQEHVRRAIDLYLDVIEAEAKERGTYDLVIPPGPPTQAAKLKPKLKPRIARR